MPVSYRPSFEVIVGTGGLANVLNKLKLADDVISSIIWVQDEYLTKADGTLNVVAISDNNMYAGCILDRKPLTDGQNILQSWHNTSDELAYASVSVMAKNVKNDFGVDMGEDVKGYLTKELSSMSNILVTQKSIVDQAYKVPISATLEGGVFVDSPSAGWKYTYSVCTGGGVVLLPGAVAVQAITGATAIDEKANESDISLLTKEMKVLNETLKNKKG